MSYPIPTVGPEEVNPNLPEESDDTRALLQDKEAIERGLNEMYIAATNEPDVDDELLELLEDDVDVDAMRFEQQREEQMGI